MNLPTKLSIIRICLTFVIIGLLMIPGWVAKFAALCVFGAASLTDWLDGLLARRWKQTTAVGALLDPIADKVLVLGLFLAFVQLRVVPAWMVLIILLRELVVTGVRLVAASRQVVLAADREGKHKTISQIVTILVILVALIIRAWGGIDGLPGALETFLDFAIVSCMWVTVVLTVVSGGIFFWRHGSILRNAVTR